MEEENTEFLQDQFLNSSDIENQFTNRLLNHALHYAKIGYPVFPLHNLENVLDEENNEILRCSCSQRNNCSHQGKHPRTRNGFKDASTEEEIIIDWWRRYPNANIGLLTGKDTGIFVLDIDWKHGGEYSLDEMRDDYRVVFKLRGKQYESLPATLTTFTGSGGRHLYFKYPLGKKIENSVSKIGKGLDIRATDSYIIAPPSNHLSGRKYQWFGVNTPIEDAPKWLIYEILKSAEKGKSEIQVTHIRKPKAETDRQIPDGERNVYLYKQACGLVNSFSEEEVLRRILIKNEKNCEPPLSRKDIERLVESALKHRDGKKLSMEMRE